MRKGIERSPRSFFSLLAFAGALAFSGIAFTGLAAAQNAAPHPMPEPKKTEAEKPDPNKPDITQPAGRAKILDELFDKLAKAQDDRDARGIATAIERVWMRSGSDTSDLLMSRAMQAMQGKDNMLALEMLDRVLEMHSDWAEALNKRATVKFLMEDYGGAMEDCARVLKLEPRHFSALAGMGFILQKTQNEKLAVRAFRRALELNPRQEEIKKIVEKLALETDGLDI